MYENDWLLRQIEQLGEAIRNMLESLRGGEPERTFELAEEAVSELLDTDLGLLDALPPDSLVTFVMVGPEGPHRARMLAEILFVRAEALTAAARHSAAAHDLDRVRRLLEAARPQAEDETLARIEEMLGWLDRP